MLGLLLQYQDVFKAPDGIPTTTPLITHAIQSGDKEAYVKPYRMSPAQLQKAEEITGDLLKQGVISESQIILTRQ